MIINGREYTGEPGSLIALLEDFCNFARQCKDDMEQARASEALPRLTFVGSGAEFTAFAQGLDEVAARRSTSPLTRTFAEANQAQGADELSGVTINQEA